MSLFARMDITFCCRWFLGRRLTLMSWRLDMLVKSVSSLKSRVGRASSFRAALNKNMIVSVECRDFKHFVGMETLSGEILDMLDTEIVAGFKIHIQQARMIDGIILIILKFRHQKSIWCPGGQTKRALLTISNKSNPPGYGGSHVESPMDSNVRIRRGGMGHNLKVEEWLRQQ